MKTSEPNAEPSNFEKYRNLRKLNSNRAQKLNYLTKSNYIEDESSNFSEFLSYLDIVPVKKISKKPITIPSIDSSDHTDPLDTSDLKSKIDLALLKKEHTNSSPNRALKPAKTKIHKCIFDYLSCIGGNQAPNESFSHVQNYLKQTQTKKCALVYDKFYCLVKIKKILQNLYLLNFLKMGDTDPNESIDSNSSIGQDLTTIQIVFTNEESSQALMSNLKKIDWCKMQNLALKKPELSVEDTDVNSLIAKLDLIVNDKSQFESFFSAEPDEQLVEIVEGDLVKFGRVLENIGGRCKISVLGSDLTEFYFMSDVYLKSFGWSKRFGFGYSNFDSLDEKERNTLESLQADMVDFMDQDLPVRKNYLLEVLYKNRFYVGCVIEVCNNELVKVRLDSNDAEVNGRVLSFFVDFKNKSKSSSLLYPCKWCERNNLALGEPNDWVSGHKFDWQVYLKNKCKETQFYMSQQTNGFFSPRSASSSATDLFKVGQFLEVALDKKDKWLYVGKIKAILGNLIFVKVYSENLRSKNKLYIFSSDSGDLYPVGWSQINNYRFFDNSFFSCLNKSVHIEPNKMDFHPSFFQFIQSEEEYCNRVHLNLNVLNYGPYFVKAKLAELPVVYGPGPIFLVIFKLVQNLLSVSEKPFKLLKIIQKIGKQKAEIFSHRIPSHRKVRLKAKERGKYLLKEVDICSKYSQLKEFLSELCHQLKCCTRMISLYEYSESIDVYHEANKNLSLEIKCCLLCTLNYYSFQNYEEVKPIEEPSKPRVKNVQKKLKPEANFSPIKTRLNTKAEMLFQEIRRTKIENEIRKDELCSDDEPLIKKTKRFNSQSTSSLLKKESQQSKTDLNNTMPCQMDNLVSKTNQKKLLSNSQSNSNIMLNNSSNPVLWSRKEVEQYLLDNKFDSNLIHLIEEHELDGQSFLMLSLPTIQNYMNLKLGPAIKLAHLVEKLKIFYFENFKK